MPLTAPDVERAIRASGGTSIDISSQQLCSLDSALSPFPSLRAVNASFNLLTTTHGFEQLSELRELKLYGNKIALVAGLER